MGTKFTKKEKVEIENLAPLDPEPEYVIKTRPPKPSLLHMNLIMLKIYSKLATKHFSRKKRRGF